MKRLLLILLFLLLPLFTPFHISAQTITPVPTVVSQAAIPSTTATTSQPNLWEQFWSWLFGLFVKTDYDINSRSSDEINSDMTSYGDKDDPNFRDKHSFAGSRSTDSQGQICLKGTVIKKVVLGTTGYENTALSKICLNSHDTCFVKPLNVSSDTLKSEDLGNCEDIAVKDLAHYFIQTKNKFYCASDKNELIETEQSIIDKVDKAFSEDISTNKLTCYQQIYNDFYLTPKDNTDQSEENTKKMIQTPISNKDQNSNASNSDTQNQLEQNFSPDGTSYGLNGLRPENDK